MAVLLEFNKMISWCHKLYFTHKKIISDCHIYISKNTQNDRICILSKDQSMS